MIGENLKKMNDGLTTIISDLRRDPHALETAWVSVIAFAGVAKTIVPLTEVVSFYPPQLPLGGRHFIRQCVTRTYSPNRYSS
ncbi:hypothetical protein PROPEN_01078 [Proteus penneri ATCC 35198]|nr:hypothetical protein PROPEN_01078 [Proteus penneri ATCC 35198]